MTPGALRSLLWALLSTGILVPAACLGKKGGGGAGEGRVESVDPREVVFSHAKIYGTFSCGRKVEDTLEQMRSAGLKAEALPRITLVEDHAADGVASAALPQQPAPVRPQGCARARAAARGGGAVPDSAKRRTSKQGVFHGEQLLQDSDDSRVAEAPGSGGAVTIQGQRHWRISRVFSAILHGASRVFSAILHGVASPDLFGGSAPLGLLHAIRQEAGLFYHQPSQLGQIEEVK
eukprot:CAMPEP_0180346364 /NCGR_PEP_ID=MMETSP0989-20121125/3839_1 /TAXON_ID=697907 /ORGANISM="non described non described, Strain CCMP2293" /LENGTH=233 /DNA_ID=CAMNT_0022335501 /DNA_START=51 /DNA_END=748 /DNA_ORIENTATION=+